MLFRGDCTQLITVGENGENGENFQLPSRARIGSTPNCFKVPYGTGEDGVWRAPPFSAFEP